MTCEVCGKLYIATRTNTYYCSNVCRAKASRDRAVKRFNNQSRLLKEQSETIKLQTKVLSNPVSVVKEETKHSSTEELSCKTGKDLSECKRPDGSHLYTDHDLFELRAKIANALEDTDDGNLLSVMNCNMVCMGLIAEFERKFQCKFDSLKIPYPVRNTFRVKYEP